jgi:hypothetical protein
MPRPHSPELLGSEGRTASSWRRGLESIQTGTWLRALVLAIVSGTIIAIPTRLVPNGFFSRMTPTRPQDYVFLAISASLLGLTLALRSIIPEDAKVAAGGIGTVFAVGCPVCNKLVVALLGTGGALSIFAPLQPVIGAAAAGLLLLGLRRQLGALDTPLCRVPAGS